MTLPERLKELRTKKKLTRKELSEVIGVSTYTIRSYELGKRKPGFDAMQKYEDFFNVTSSYLNGEADINNYDFYIKYSDSKNIEFQEKLKIIKEKTKNIPAENKTSIYSALTCFSQLLAECPLTESSYIEYAGMLELLMSYLIGISTYLQRKYNPSVKEKALFSMEEYYVQIENILKDMEVLYKDFYNKTKTISDEPDAVL